MRAPLVVKEFDSIIGNADYQHDARYTYLDKDTFVRLVEFIREYESRSNDSDALDFMSIKFKRGVGDVVSLKNYVGLIQMDNGFQLEILPKIDLGYNDANNAQTKAVFLRMLRSMKDFPGKLFNEANLKADRMNLYEIFINMYLQEVRHLVKHGLQSGYLTHSENLNFYKGKLLVNTHIRRNLVHKERFFVSFDEFHQNRPENRLVKATLEKLYKLTVSAENSKEIRQLLCAFELVQSSVDYDKDFSKVEINRNMKDYENLMKWSKVFLKNKSFTTFSGSTKSRAILFPMESVYESYVAQQIKKIFRPRGWTVSSQAYGEYLFVQPRRQFALRPDIVIQRGNRRIIMDTKWKRLNNNEHSNFGISQPDMYQMYAYSKKYKTSEIWLLYPVTDEVRTLSPIEYDSGDNTTVKIHFVDVSRIEKSLSELMERIDEEVIVGDA